jgi:hypothetical protein
MKKVSKPQLISRVAVPTLTVKHEFYHYVRSFYGTGEIYDLGVSEFVLKRACDVVRHSPNFEGFTADREKVRFIIEYNQSN